MKQPCRYAVLGAAGQLGSDLCPLLDGDVVRLSRYELDLSKPREIDAKLRTIRPDILFNCAAYNLVDRAEEEPDQAFLVNAFGVRALAQACAAQNVTLVHFSTDYVFGLESDRSTPYLEGDAPGPLSVYGLSKLAGEYFVRNHCPKHFVIRTCGLYGIRGSGGKGTNFVETMLRLAGQGKPLRVVEDQILTPTSTADLAASALEAVQHLPFGLYHMTNAGQCSWFEFATAILELAGLRADLSPISSAAYASKAKRPSYSVLHSSHEMAPKLRPWREALAKYLTRRAKESRGKVG